MVMMARAWEALQKGDSPGQSPSEHLDSDLILNPKEVSVHISPFQTPPENNLLGVSLRWSHTLPGRAVLGHQLFSEHIHTITPKGWKEAFACPRPQSLHIHMKPNVP